MSTSTKVILKIYNSNKTVIATKTHAVPYEHFNMIFVNSKKYMAYCYGSTVVIRDTTTFNQTCIITESLDIYDIKVTDKNLFVSLPTSIKQYNVTNCANIGNHSVGAKLLATV